MGDHMQLQQHLLTNISEAYRLIKQADKVGGAARKIKVVILRNFSAEYLVPFVRAYFLRAGIDAEIVLGGFDTVQQDLFTPQVLEGADLVVLALDLTALAPDWLLGGAAVAGLADRVIGLASSALQSTSVPVVINTFIRPIQSSLGLNSLADSDSADAMIVDVNHALHQFSRENRGKIILVDWERLAVIAGAEETFDLRMGYIARSPFKPLFLSAYAYEIFKVCNVLRGGAKKCLVLDCDNTIWGGIVGELGVQHIQLDRNNYPGRAFYDFQRSVVRLANRGVMVALCSKNNEEDVLAVLDQHPDCLIKREHLVSWRVNWEGKETNIASMVRELNIGMDSVVFVDDNPTECTRVKDFLPDITVRMVPEKTYLLPSLLDGEGLFNLLTLTEEDKNRAKMYQAENMRQKSESKFASVEDFLASLELAAYIKHYSPEDAGPLARVAQLSQKTNQFNLTTRRYSETEILDFAGRPDYMVLGMNVTDKFGDFGLTGVLIAQVDGKVARMDSFMLSCRILGRNLERQFVITALQNLQEKWGVDFVVAEYLPTQKNAQVADFWDKNGLQVQSKDDTRTAYAAALADLDLNNIPYIKVIR